MLNKKWAILAKLETAYGVDASPVVGSDLIYTSNPSIEIVSKSLERTHPMSGFGKNATANIGQTVKVSFSSEFLIDWNAAADTTPSIGKLLRACNFTEIISSGTKITYQNNSDQNGESLTLYIHKDGLLQKVTGCRGEVKGSHVAGEKVTFDFEFEGIYKVGSQVDAAFPTFTVSLPKVGIFQNAEIKIGNFTSPIVQNYNWGMNNELKNRPDANSNQGIYSAFVGNSVPSISLDPEIVALSEFNARSIWENNTLVNVSAVIKDPTVSTKKCTITHTNMQYKDVKDGEREGIMTYDLNLECGGTADVKLEFVG